MTEQLVEIGGRLAALRDIMDISVEKMAEELHLSPEEYLAYERGQRDYNFSFLYNAANILGVDHLNIIRGESPKLHSCALTRSGEGYNIEREAYDYKHLAYTFKDRMADPYLVTVEPGKNELLTWYSHEGQEFNYMVSGTMEVLHGSAVYEMKEGDSIFFDSGLPHTMKALGDKAARFIAVVIKPDGAHEEKGE
ncbi:MAG: cupin domain-containing protein [Oscillospiraceae bacterium]|nr:cupin domain-containing protein [Oscillospiraceae bacterium]